MECDIHGRVEFSCSRAITLVPFLIRLIPKKDTLYRTRIKFPSILGMNMHKSSKTKNSKRDVIDEMRIWVRLEK